MDTIILFHRWYLTDTYMLISKELSNKFNFIHVAFSQHEVDIIRKYDNYVPIINYRESIADLLKTTTLSMDLIEDIEDMYIKETNGRFTLNMSINGDRSASLYTYEEMLLLAQCYYLFWDRIFSEAKNVKYLFHETPSALLVHMCSIVCRKYKIRHIYPFPGFESGSHYYYEYEDYGNPLIEKRYKYYKEHPTEIDYDLCRQFLEPFIKSYDIKDKEFIQTDRSMFYLWIRSVRNELSYYKNKHKYDRMIDSMDYMGLTQKQESERYRNVKAYKKKINFEQIRPEEHYYYYPLHLEPEATVEYFADGYYSNQIKLIQNIAAQIPAGTYLYVKDHPHYLGYRDVQDYEKLQRIPNVRLLNRNIPSKLIIKNCLGVFTINGSAGFEALMLRKPVVCFGRSYYSFYDGVKYIDNIKDIKKLFVGEGEIPVCNEECLMAYLYSYLKSAYRGDVFMWRDPKTIKKQDFEKSAKDLASSFMEYINDTCQ